MGCLTGCLSSISVRRPYQRSLRPVGAQRVASIGIVGLGKRAGPRAAAHPAKLAEAALAAILIGVAEARKYLRMTVDRYRALSAYVPGRYRQESGRIDIPGVRDEHNAVTVSDSKAPSDRRLADRGVVQASSFMRM